MLLLETTGCLSLTLSFARTLVCGPQTLAFPAILQHRLKDRILYEEEEKEHKEQEIILMLVPLLYNFRNECVGLNQLRNTYIPNWSKDSDYIIDF